MNRPASTTEFYAPPEWKITVRVCEDERLLSQRVVPAGDHLVAAAQELLQLQIGFGPEMFGRVDPKERFPIVVELQPLSEGSLEAGAMSTSDGLGG